MTILTKDFRAGSAGVPGTPATTTPGTPPIPPTPAYCVDQVTTVPGGGIIYVNDPGDPLTGRPPGVIGIPVSGPPVNVITHVCHEAMPGVPGVPGTTIPGVPASLPSPADYNAGWNAGARSIGSLTADGQYKFSVAQDVVGVATGFNTSDTGAGYVEIQHGILCESGRYRIIEGGVPKTLSAGYVTASVFTIARTGTLVRYFKDGVLVYASLVPSNGTVFADASLYMGHSDRIIDASLVTTVDLALQNFSGSVTGVLSGLVGFAGNVAGGFMRNPQLGQLVPNIRSNPTGEVRGVLGGLRGAAVAAGVGASCSGILGGLTGYAESGLITPQFSMTAGILQQLAGFSLALSSVNGTVAGVLGGLRGYASNAPNGNINQGTPLPPGGPDAQGDWPGRSGGQLRLLVGLSFDKTAWDAAYSLSGHIILPMLEVASTAAADGVLKASIVLPSPLTVQASVAPATNIVLPAIKGMAAGIFENLAQGVIILPTPLVVTASVLSGTIADAAVLLPRLKASGLASSEGRLIGGVVLPGLTLSGRIYQDLVLHGDIRLPRLQVESTIGAAENYARGFVILPMLVMTQSIDAALTLPRLRAAGSIVQGVAQQDRIGYAMNLSNSALTTFSNFPFRAIVRAYNQYWAIGLDGGLYRLTGDMDDAMPIDWEFESGLADFGVMGQKGVLAAYVDGVFENGATLSMVTDSTRRVYSHRAAGDYTNHMMHRIAVGRGVRSHNMAFGMANPKGGYLELDRITPEYVIIPRNL